MLRHIETYCAAADVARMCYNTVTRPVGAEDAKGIGGKDEDGKQNNSREILGRY